MTTLRSESATCAVCGSVSSHKVVVTTNTLGHQDLDTRPPEHMRSTLSHWVQRCPACGYCADDISQSAETDRSMVGSQRYVEMLEQETMPICARAFRCEALIQEAAGRMVEAGWSTLQAAWACDDARAAAAAAQCRSRAVGLFLAAVSAGRSIADEPGAQDALLADLLRRCGRFDEAIARCANGLLAGPQELVALVLRFQRARARERDAGRYTLADAGRQAVESDD